MTPALVVIFGFVAQGLLLASFAAHRWAPAREGSLGIAVYAMGIPGAVLAAAAAAAGEGVPWAIGPALYAAWAALGAWLDLVRRVPWRVPPRWSILIPYALLLMAALLAIWIPLWSVSRALWVAFGILYAAHTTLNIASHRA